MLTPALRAANGQQVIRQLCAALEHPAYRGAAIASLQELIDKVDIGALGQTYLKRLMIWFGMLGALDEAFACVHHALDDLHARRGTIGTAWGWMWVPELSAFRKDPRFRPLLARFRFEAFWNEHGPPDGHILRDGRLIC